MSNPNVINAVRPKWLSAVENNETFNMFYNRLVNIAISAYKWTNLPDTLDERFLELTLFETGRAVFFEDEILGFLALTCTYGTPLNVYRLPTNYRAYAVNGYNKELDDKNSVLIWSNFIHIPDVNVIRQFAYRLYEIQRTIDVNVTAQKTPVLILANEKTRLTLKNVYMQWDGNEPVIVSDKSAGDLTDALKVLKTDAPFIASDLNILKRAVWSEALNYLGITANSGDKKERLLVSEINYSGGGIAAERAVRLGARKQACERINKMFGLDISVEFNNEILDVIMKDEFSYQQKEEIDNEQIYD